MCRVAHHWGVCVCYTWLIWPVCHVTHDWPVCGVTHDWHDLCVMLHITDLWVMSHMTDWHDLCVMLHMTDLCVMLHITDLCGRRRRRRSSCTYQRRRCAVTWPGCSSCAPRPGSGTRSSTWGLIYPRSCSAAASRCFPSDDFSPHSSPLPPTHLTAVHAQCWLLYTFNSNTPSLVTPKQKPGMSGVSFLFVISGLAFDFSFSISSLVLLPSAVALFALSFFC